MNVVATQNDSFPLSAFEDRLWSELEQFHAQLASEPNVPGPGRNPRRRYLAVVGAVAVAASIVGIVLVAKPHATTNTTDNEPSVTSTSTAPTEPLPPLVVAHVIIVKEIRYPDGGVLTEWMDGRTDSSRVSMRGADGTLRSEHAMAIVVNPDGTRTSTETEVDHETREYYQDSTVGAGDIPSMPESLVREIADGFLVADGSEKVDGVELLRFVTAPSSATTSPAAGDGPSDGTYDRIVWVGPDSGRPVKESSFGDIGGDLTTTFTYLPRTPDNLARLVLTVPDGYTMVDECEDGATGSVC